MADNNILGGLGIAAGLASSLFGKGKKVKAPDYIPIDTTKEQAGAIAGNLDNFKAAGQLATNTNEFNQGELEKYLRRAIPNYDQLVQKSSDVILKSLSGEIPGDVASSIRRNSATRAVYGGYAGSGMEKNLTARDLGLKTYEITQRALDSAGQFITRQRSVGSINPIGPESMFLTPSQRINTALTNAQSYYGASMAKAQADAAPDPTISSLSSFVSNAAGMAVGYATTDSLANKYFQKSAGSSSPFYTWGRG